MTEEYIEPPKLKCPKCGNDKVHFDSGYQTLFRCPGCSYVGNRNDYILLDPKVE